MTVRAKGFSTSEFGTTGASSGRRNDGEFALERDGIASQSCSSRCRGAVLDKGSRIVRTRGAAERMGKKTHECGIRRTIGTDDRTVHVTVGSSKVAAKVDKRENNVSLGSLLSVRKGRQGSRLLASRAELVEDGVVLSIRVADRSLSTVLAERSDPWSVTREKIASSENRGELVARERR